MLRLKTHTKALQLIFERAPNVPQYIETDEGKLRQVLINLLGNAIKFTEEGGVILRVKKESGQKQVRLLFEVEDTGPGIASKEIDKLFEAFGQTETGRKSQQGTGLGLPISQKFVELMGGTIRVSSILGSGSLFAFDIKARVVGAKEVLNTQSLRKVIGLAANQPQYRILVVDDRLESRLLLVKLLSAVGLQVKEAENGQEAIALWENWSPHLIWMDMRMPLMDGYEATRRIKSTLKGQATVIIALTASAFEEDRLVVLSAGCDDFMRKPFREEVLWEKMAQHLGIQYLYEEITQEHSLNTDLLPSVIASVGVQMKLMEPEWRQKIKQAAQECNDDLILELTAQIPDAQVELKNTLSELAHQFLFDKLIELTDIDG